MLRWKLFLAGLSLAPVPVFASAPAPSPQAESSSTAAAGEEDASEPPDEGEAGLVSDAGMAGLPEVIRRMLADVLENGDSNEIKAVVKYAANANPEAADAIRALVDRRNDRIEQERVHHIRQAGAFDLWDGKFELGGFRSTGTSSEFGVSSSISATRKGLRWTHAILASADYREANGQKSRESILASYNPTLKFDERNFAYWLAQYERDPVVGYDHRLTGSLGIGYTLVSSSSIDMSATLGPSLRETDYTDDGKEVKFGARSSLNFRWALAPTLSLRQTASAYAEKDTASVVSLTALEARLIAMLTARFSYNLQYESGSKLTDRAFGTTSKVTFIYDF